MSSDKSPGSVFIIDDSVDSCTLMALILSESGYRVETSIDPIEAFKKKLPFQPDILLLDIMMPGMSGIEIMERIGKSSQRSSFRIISVSGLNDQGDIDRAYAAGANDFLAKPFQPQELLLRVEKQMGELRKSKNEDVVPGSRESPPQETHHVEPKKEDTLPRFGAQKDVAVSSPVAGHAPRTMPTGAKILAVDDDQAIRSIVKATLEVIGHRVILAEDGEDGIRFAKREEPDLIITDIMMPRMNGYEMVSRLASDPLTSAIPILMLTSQDSSEEVTKGLSGYSDEYITKPFRPDELCARVGALIRRTKGRVKDKREQIWLIEKFADRGQRGGGKVFSPHLSQASNFPDSWRGPLPDLLVQKKRSYTAYLIESVETLHDERLIARWKDLEDIKGVKLHLVGTSKEARQLALQVKKEYGLKAQVQWMKPRQWKGPAWWKKYMTPPIIFCAAGLAIILLLLWGLIQIKATGLEPL